MSGTTDGRQIVAPAVCAALAVLAVACGGGASHPMAPSPELTPRLSVDRAIGASGGFGQLTTSGLPDFALCLSEPSPPCFSAARARRPLRLDARAVSAPVNLSGTVIGVTVTLTWTAPTTTVTEYIIEAGSSPGLANLASFSTGTALTTFTATNVPPGTYYVRVRAIDLTSVGPASNEIAIVVVGSGCLVPGAPSGLAVTANVGGTVGLRWDAASGSSSPSYVLEAGTASGLANLANGDVGAATTFTASGVGAGTYYVRVRARNGCGTSAPSNEIVVTVVAAGLPGIITIAAYPIALSTTDTSSHGITLTVDGRLVTTTFVYPGVPAVYPRFQGALSDGTHRVTATMTSWDSLLIQVGSASASVDANSFVLLSSSWTLQPISTRVACSGRVLFSGRASGSITFTFNVVAGTVSACPAPPAGVG